MEDGGLLIYSTIQMRRPSTSLRNLMVTARMNLTRWPGWLVRDGGFLGQAVLNSEQLGNTVNLNKAYAHPK